MEQTTQPSFIPREVPQVSRADRPQATGLLDLFTLLAIVLFVTSGALAAGVFLYHQFEQASASSKLDQLERASAAFEPALIQELTRLDDRMRAASDVLGRHIAPSAFFSMLEQTTIQTLSFRSLNFEGTDPQRMTIEMTGIAESVNSIALQADLFSKVGMVVNPIFSNIDRRPDGVHFTLSALLNPASLNYSALVRSFLESAQQQTPAAQQEAGGEASSPFGESAPQGGSSSGATAPAAETPSQEPSEAVPAQ